MTTKTEINLLLCSIFVSLLHFGVSDSNAQTRHRLEDARKKMVQDFVIGSGVKDKRVIQAMYNTPRHEFIHTRYIKQAYFDAAVPIGSGQTISSPFIVSYMTESLSPRPTDKVLEIGTGSGYQAAVLSPLVKSVYSIEIVETLGKNAARTLKRLKYDNVHTKIGDGYKGWAEHAPFDKVIVTCSPEKVPAALAQQLKEGGLMVIPVGERYQQTLFLMRKKNGKLVQEALRPTLFVPMTGRAEERRQVQPDPENPVVINGGFEEPPAENGFMPGWYYQRQLKHVKDENAPEGNAYVEFTNTDLGRSAHLLQGAPIDGSKVHSLTLSAYVKTSSISPGTDEFAVPLVVVSFYDEQRRDLGYKYIGPFLGTSDWSKSSKIIAVPPKASECLVRIGLYGALGTVSFDDVRIEKTP